MSGSQDLRLQGVDTRNDLHAHNINLFVDGQIPFNDRWTLGAGLGGTVVSSLIDHPAAPQYRLESDADLLLFQANVTRFFLSDEDSPLHQTLDRAPSISLFFSGSMDTSSDNALQVRQMDQPISHSDVSQYSLVLAMARPLRYSSVNGGIGGSWDISDTDEHGPTAGSKLDVHSLLATAGIRRYWAGWTPFGLTGDSNPDRWISTAVQFTGVFSLSGDQEVRLASFYDRRDSDLRKAQAVFDIKWPFSDHWTLKMAVGGQWSRSHQPERPFLSASVMESWSFQAAAGLRYYFSTP